MPIYEFKCHKGHITEELCSATTKDTITCPDCGGIAKRIISRTAKPVIKIGMHTDSGLPIEYISHAKIPEIYERNLTRQGKAITPDDM